jgi:hypothetical protein
MEEQRASVVVQLVRQPPVFIVRHLQTLACLLVSLENFVKILRAEQGNASDAQKENGQPLLESPMMLNAQTCVRQDNGLLQQV